MALITKEVIPPKKEQLNVRIDPEVMRALERYCEFAEGSQHYVVEELLRYAFSNDRDFQAWLEREPPSRQKDKPKKTD